MTVVMKKRIITTMLQEEMYLMLDLMTDQDIKKP